jgi:hypothetical protein
MRSYKRWSKAIPDLESANIHRLKNPQNVTIGPGNCPTGFAELVDRLK